jgi:hypothetical protein
MFPDVKSLPAPMNTGGVQAAGDQSGNPDLRGECKDGQTIWDRNKKTPCTISV